MDKIFYLMTLLAQHDPQYTTAADTTRRAILETPQMKREMVVIKKYATRKFYKKAYETTGLTPHELAYASYVYPVISKKVSTKPFKNLRYKSKSNNFVVIPEAEYHFNKQYSAAVFFIKEF